jgi:hypothetical protein
MQSLLNEILFPKKGAHAQIFDMVPSALSNVPFHQDTRSVTRYFAENFPVHLAIHEVSPVMLPPREYTQLHCHNDFDEINIIVSRQSLLYKIELDNEQYVVSNNSCIWIPRGMMHAANVLQGTGHFITLRFS